MHEFVLFLNSKQRGRERVWLTKTTFRRLLWASFGRRIIVEQQYVLSSNDTHITSMLLNPFWEWRSRFASSEKKECVCFVVLCSFSSQTGVEETLLLHLLLPVCCRVYSFISCSEEQNIPPLCRIRTTRSNDPSFSYQTPFKNVPVYFAFRYLHMTSPDKSALTRQIVGYTSEMCCNVTVLTLNLISAKVALFLNNRKSC